jgi:hypothetical protein
LVEPEHFPPLTRILQPPPFHFSSHKVDEEFHMTDTLPGPLPPDELGSFVRQTLCAHDHLDPTQTAFFRTPIVRGGRVTGFVFHVEGPRMLRTSAVWSADDCRVVFYDSTGQKVRVAVVPGPVRRVA